MLLTTNKNNSKNNYNNYNDNWGRHNDNSVKCQSQII